MRSGQPEGLPELFLDRSLGRHQVPALLRAAGLHLRTLTEVYGAPADQDIEDTDWLALAGSRGWVVLMKDERIRYRPVERAVLIDSGVRAFCLTGGNLRAAVMAEQFLTVMDQITATCRQPGPFLYVISSRGLRQVTL